MKKTSTTVGIVGHGTVGQATALLFQDVAVYDPPKGHSDLAALARCPVVLRLRSDPHPEQRTVRPQLRL